MTSRFLEELPLEKWTLGPPRKAVLAPAPPARPAPEPVQPLWLTVALKVGADLQLAPAGGSFGGGVVGDVGRGAHALFVDLGMRGSVPRPLGQGSYYTLTLAGGLGWRFAMDAWLARVGALAGTMRVAGSGFVADGSEWLPWIELDAGFGRRLGPVALLLTGAASPFRHSAITADGVLQEEISNLRLGLALEFPLVEADF